MGNCLSGYHNTRHINDRKFTLAILGLDNAGKTVAAKGLQGESLDTTAPTVGFSSVEFKFKKWKITLFDLGGGKRIRDIWKNYFAEIYGVIYVVDSSAPERLEESQEVLRSVIEHNKITGKPLLLLANKQDEQGALDELDVCQRLQLEDLVNINKCLCRVETCSAILGQGKKLDPAIEAGFHWLVNTISEDWERLHRRVQKDVADLKEHQAREKQERAERVRRLREERECNEKEEEKGDDYDNDDSDEPIGFRRLDIEEISRKEARLKEKKEKEKEQTNLELSESPYRSSKRLNRARLNEASHTENGLPVTSNIGWSEQPSSYLNVDDNRLVSQSALKLSLMSSKEFGTSPRISSLKSSEDLSQRSTDIFTDRIHHHITNKNHLSLDPNTSFQTNGCTFLVDGRYSDGEKSIIKGSISRSPWLSKPALPTQQAPRYSDVNESDHVNKPHGSLLPLAPLGSLTSDKGKKKKYKKKAKRNQTLPTDDEGYDVYVHERPQVPNFVNEPPTDQNQLSEKISQNHCLKPWVESNDLEEGFSQKWQLAEELSDLPDERMGQQFRPNSEEHDDLIT